ncbi:tRNA-splicing endonuclease subunit sen54-like protein [Apodospora peruviana]|uniref:tRNA-splicing endonuclease subunit sen54-like protein n=1 Tax=Apodospora peruviana TaxID=516989 RepID=A0AAE0HY81_9PEZI|nr:tRNA-splicing endonuclease subunit sen54-like protein [Apodospora peruviana]
MASLDDEDDIITTTQATVGNGQDTDRAATPAATADQDLIETADDVLEEEPLDFRLFRKNTHISAQTIRKGEKDFESHGTRAQQSALDQSRQAMKDVLSYTRVHTPQNWVRGWYFPEWWADYHEEESENPDSEEKKPAVHVRDRVVILEGSSVASMNLGRAVTGQPKDRPGRGKDWLLPEEALYLVERGSLDLWWPTKGMDEIFPVTGGATDKEEAAVTQEEKDKGEEDEYAMGFPLSVQAAYSLLVGDDDRERGKVSLRKFQVFSNLKRAGYNVLRAPPTPAVYVQPSAPPSEPLGLLQWLFSSLFSRKENKKQLPYGPLVQPGLYRSYIPIYRQLALLPRHKPLFSLLPTTTSKQQPKEDDDPFTIHYHVWKSAQKWSKLRHPAPAFYLAVVDAQETAVPALDEIAGLIEATPPAPGKAEWTGPGRMYARLKHGHRNVLVAVVDHGVINYMRFAEGAFGEEELFTRFDGRGTRGGGRGGGKRGGGRGGGNRGRNGNGRGGGRGGGNGRGRGGGGRGQGK